MMNGKEGRRVGGDNKKTEGEVVGAGKNDLVCIVPEIILNDMGLGSDL